jgi:hypothetical protein
LGCIAFGEIDINALDFIGESAFDNCASLKVVDSWTNKGLGKNSIGNWAFEKCVNLVNITVPNFVTLIHTGAFSDCANLSTITLPTSVTIIDNYAFYNCARLTNFEFVESDSSSTSLSIGDHAFVGCANLKLIQLATKTSTTWTGANWFDSCPVFGTIKSNQLATSANMVDWITRLPGEGNTAWYGLQNPAE